LDLPGVFGIICAAIAVFSLCVICHDSPKYKGGDDALPVSITYSPPKAADPMGFWEIFSAALENTFFGR